MVGKRLLHRTGRGMSPTTEGELLLSYAHRILALGEAASARLRERAVAGSVRIGLSEDVAVAALPAALGRLKRSCPQLHLEVVVDDGERLAARWQEGTLDVALGVCAAFVDEPVETWSVDLHWVCGIDDVPRPDQPLDVIVYAEPCSWRRLVFDELTAAGRDFRVSLTSHNVGATIAAVENGLGVAVLTTECIRPDTMRVISIGPDGASSLNAQFGMYERKRPGRRVAVARKPAGLDGVQAAAPHGTARNLTPRPHRADRPCEKAYSFSPSQTFRRAPPGLAFFADRK